MDRWSGHESCRQQDDRASWCRYNLWLPHGLTIHRLFHHKGEPFQIQANLLSQEDLLFPARKFHQILVWKSKGQALQRPSPDELLISVQHSFLMALPGDLRQFPQVFHRAGEAYLRLGLFWQWSLCFRGDRKLYPQQKAFFSLLYRLL